MDGFLTQFNTSKHVSWYDWYPSFSQLRNEMLYNATGYISWMYLVTKVKERCPNILNKISLLFLDQIWKKMNAGPWVTCTRIKIFIYIKTKISTGVTLIFIGESFGSRPPQRVIAPANRNIGTHIITFWSKYTCWELFSHIVQYI